MKNNKAMLGMAFSFMILGLYADFEPDFTDKQLPPVKIQEIFSQIKELLKPQAYASSGDAISKSSQSPFSEDISSNSPEFTGYSSSLSDKQTAHFNSGKADYRVVFAIIAIPASFILYKLIYSKIS